MDTADRSPGRAAAVRRRPQPARHQPGPGRLLALVLVAAATLLAACSSPTPTSTPATSAPADATGTGGATSGSPTDSGGGDPAAIAARLAKSTFASGSCAFDVPSGTSPRCGTVTVPANWATGAGEVRLAVAVFPGTGKQPAADPVVYLDGGPGSNTLDSLRFLSADLLDPLAERGDVVFFDQRGAGRTTPSLGCDEVTDAVRKSDNEPKIDDATIEANLQAALKACRSRLEGQGIDLSVYNTINNAHDTEAVRIALKYDRWNLYGISYGTRLALEVMRQHPGGVRSTVIDSVYPPDGNATRDDPAAFVASYRAVVAACAAEPACAAQGDLAQRFRKVIAAYDAKPVQVEVRNFVSDETDQVWVNGGTIVNVVVGSLYSPEQFTDLPELVGELEAGKTHAIEQFLSQGRTQEDFFTTGMFYAFECNEEVPTAEPAQVAAALPPDPFGRKPKFDYADNEGSLAFATCGAWGMGQPGPLATEPVFSDVPTLVLSGAYDPVTPPEWARSTMSRLSRAFLVSAPYGAHGVSPGECGMGVVRAFLDAPDKAPDGSCFASRKLRFVGSPDPASVELEPVTYTSIDGATRISTVKPKDWTGVDLDGEWLRQASFLDPTEIVQLAGNRLLAANLEAYVTTTLGVTLPRGDNVTRNGRTWLHRSGRNENTAVEWYQGDQKGQTVVVILVAQPAEVDQLAKVVLDPALDKIALS